ncbi:MAG: hypothetical protein ABIJ09_26975 [Pseudomonadota bacterium]
MNALADFLLQNRLCTRDQIEDAVQNQVILGGRLGTNLIEMGYLDERTLAECLSRIHKVRALFGDAIEPEVAALRLMPANLADRLSVVPYRTSSRQVEVLCLDPSDFTTLDHVGFHTGKKIQPIVVAEVRLWHLLRQHYGIDRGLRGLALADLPATSVTQVDAAVSRPSFTGDLMSEAAFDALYQAAHDESAGGEIPDPATPVPAELGTPASTAQASVHNLPPLAQPLPAQAPLPSGRTPTAQLPVLTGIVVEEVSEEFLLDDIIEEAEALAPLAPVAAPPVPSRPVSAPPLPEPLPVPVVDETPLSFTEATTHLASARDRNEVAQLVLRFARSQFKRAMLFTVHGRMAVGWEEVGVDIPHFSRLVIPLEQPSVFQLAVHSRAHVLGSLQKTPTNIQFLGAAGKQVPRSAFVMPVLVRGRVVNIFYGDNGHKEHCPSDVGELLILALKIAQSYESLFKAKAKTLRGE